MLSRLEFVLDIASGLAMLLQTATHGRQELKAIVFLVLMPHIAPLGVRSYSIVSLNASSWICRPAWPRQTISMPRNSMAMNLSSATYSSSLHFPFAVLGGAASSFFALLVHASR
ncbi:hypothetical protein HRR88_006123 [Exophiala dermatitidis]|nr:hypothetical protein HRR79_006671 [Exophiala dermatitidis]KAJ4597457.1 hypothetical protein HRR84_004218 [Exophiala dermatitidis]KAJ4620275.1 hypothetical protein HRR88_006123 [Exophiala dermatitidis]KAJ4669995.1 hypothetical protein HRR93_005806 [Exophiala dermatitidis]